MEWVRGFLRYLGKVIVFILGSAVFVVIFQYLTCPVYIFPETAKFEGPFLYNPYQSVEGNFWRRANFQIQSHAWGGLTDGRKNNNKDIDSVYRILGYDIIATSDYQKINRWGAGKESYIPVYEHGYGLFKNHQVLLGAEKVNWRDYPLFQTLHNKQHIINILRENNELVYIAHPKLRNGYKPDDMKYLTGYDGLEVLNYVKMSVEHWDSALSAGKYVTVMGNDDAHDISRLLEIGHRCTYIHSRSLEGDSIMASLKAGRSYGADIYRELDETLEEKAAKAKRIASLDYIRVYGDTIEVRMNREAKEFRFIGQGGVLKGNVEGSEVARYCFTEEDTYIRTEVSFADNNTFYFNPVVRTYGNIPSNPVLAQVDPVRSWIFWILSWGTVVFILFNIYYLRKRYRKSRIR